MDFILPVPVTHRGGSNLQQLYHVAHIKFSTKVMRKKTVMNGSIWFQPNGPFQFQLLTKSTSPYPFGLSLSPSSGHGYRRRHPDCRQGRFSVSTKITSDLPSPALFPPLLWLPAKLAHWFPWSGIDPTLLFLVRRTGAPSCDEFLLLFLCRNGQTLTAMGCCCFRVHTRCSAECCLGNNKFESLIFISNSINRCTYVSFSVLRPQTLSLNQLLQVLLYLHLPCAVKWAILTKITLLEKKSIE